jgi:hypothetical protein
VAGTETEGTGKNPKNLIQLNVRCKEEWSKSPISICVNLVKKYCDRLKAVLAAKCHMAEY